MFLRCQTCRKIRQFTVTAKRFDGKNVRRMTVCICCCTAANVEKDWPEYRKGSFGERVGSNV